MICPICKTESGEICEHMRHGLRVFSSALQSLTECGEKLLRMMRGAAKIVAELEQNGDLARLDWLERNDVDISQHPEESGVTVYVWNGNVNDRQRVKAGEGRNLREAIDDAIAKEKGAAQ